MNASGKAWTGDGVLLLSGDVERRVFISLLVLAVALGLNAWLAKSQEGVIAVVAAPQAEWRRVEGWYHPRLVRWSGLKMNQPYEFSEVRLKAGDDAQWAAPEWVDDDWQKAGFGGVPIVGGITWVRFRVRSVGTSDLPLGLVITVSAAYELFWDGVLIGRSGRPAATRTDEIPGPTDNLFGLSATQARAGEHVVALRLSTFHRSFASPRTTLLVFLQPTNERQVNYAQRAVAPALGAGAMFLLGTVTAVIGWLAARRPAFWVFAALCGTAGLLQAVIGARWYLNYTYDWLGRSALTTQILAGCLGGLVVLQVFTLFRVPRAKGLVLASWLLIAAAAAYSPAGKSLDGSWMMIAALSAGCLGAAWAGWRRQPSAWWVAAGLGVSAFLVAVKPYTYINTEFVFRFLPTVLAFTAALGIGLREERAAGQRASLRAARLEIELLKKNIQPHFLMNTLTSLLEVIEQQPRAAGKMIEALATEFRILSGVSGEQQIPLWQELQLCDAHLRIMSLQRGREFTLQTDLRGATTPIPPALFHTLIENGLTHQIIRTSPAEFVLAEIVTPTTRTFRLTAPGQAPAGPDTHSGAIPKEGTGLRYVKARLEESFPGAWQLHGAIDEPEGTWTTTLILTRQAADVPLRRECPAPSRRTGASTVT